MVKAEVKDGEEEMEVEAERPVMVVEALPAATLLSPSLNVETLPTASLSLTPPSVEKQRAIVKPQILTHVIDGFVIQEGPVPFPVCWCFYLLL